MQFDRNATPPLPVPALGSKVNFAVTKALSMAASVGMSTSATVTLAKLVSTASGTHASGAATLSAKGPTMSKASAS